MSIQKTVIGCLLFSAALFSVAAAAGTVDVRGMRVWSGPQKTRAVIDLSGPAQYKLFSLKDPHRVVIDLKDSGLGSGIDLLTVNGGVLGGVRHAARGKGTLRLVFDLRGTVRARSFLLTPAMQYGHRLVVDLFTGSEGAVEPVKKVVPERLDRDVIVAVDAGHGGEDPGAIGATGTREKVITMAIAKELVAQINRESGMRAVLVRSGDYYVSLRKRSAIARKHRADLFISIHADAFPDRKVRGSSVFVLSKRGSSSEAARWLAAKENASDLVGGVTLDDKDSVLASVLLDLSQTATQEASDEVAENVFAAMNRVGEMHKNRVERAAFAVLKSPDVPSVLIETAFISNPREEKRLKSSKYRRKLAVAMVTGIRDYFHERPPPGTWIAARVRSESYTVTRGDTLSGIADRYRITVASLRKRNELKGDLLRVGDTLLIPTI